MEILAPAEMGKQELVHFAGHLQPGRTPLCNQRPAPELHRRVKPPGLLGRESRGASKEPFQPSGLAEETASRERIRVQNEREQPAVVQVLQIRQLMERSARLTPRRIANGSEWGAHHAASSSLPRT